MVYPDGGSTGNGGSADDGGTGGRDGAGTDGRDDRFPNGDPPGPDPVPVVGNALPFFRRPFEYRHEVAAEYGDVVDVSGLGRRAFLVSHPDHVRRVLVEEDHRFEKPDFEKGFVSSAFGDSLAFVDGEEWRRARRALQPVFTMDRVAGYGDAMVAAADELVDEFAEGERIALDEATKRLTFRVLVRTLFGVDDDAIPDLYDDFDAVATKTRPMLAVVPDWIPTATNRRYREALDNLEGAIDDLVERRRANPGEGEDLLSLLIRASEAGGGGPTDGTTTGDDDGSGDGDPILTDRRLRDEMMGFLFAGHETTAIGLTFALYLCSATDGARERLESELAETLAGDPPTVADLGDLDYTGRAVTEALRLYPPNHMIPREPVEEVAIGGYRIPAGSSVYCSQWVVHRDDRWYDDPAEFRPGRWREDRAADRPEYAYFPFGGGPRHCIGMRFARLELRLATARIAQRVRFDVDDEVPELGAGLTMHTRGPVEATVRFRE